MKRLRLGAHLPWAQVDCYLGRVLELGLVPEIAIKGPELDVIDDSTLQRVTGTLAAARIRPRVHAPFFDLNPGALDPLIRQATRQRLEQALNFAARLNAHLLVLHPGVDKWRYPNLEHAWLAQAVDFFPPLIEQASQIHCQLVIENIYEEQPDILVQLVERLDTPWFGHCFDAGHWHLFGKSTMRQWLRRLGAKLYHLHLHDNHGRADEHLPVGSGSIDFVPLQEYFLTASHLPSITLEAHQAEHLYSSLEQTQALFN